jgi:adenosylcobinamide-GDP ribazoletransferase
MRSLLLAVGFLTRLPVPVPSRADAAMQARSLPWYPLVGALIGLVLCAWAWGLARIGAPPLLVAALVLALWVAITGALHLDGLADSADAWLGGHGATPERTRERTLAIMRDPRSGPAAVVALVVLLLLKFAALASMPTVAWQALLLAPTLARATVVLAFASTPYVRSSGLGSGLASAPRLPSLGTLALCVAGCAAMGRPAWIALAAATLLFLLWRRACMKRLGGMTGDTCGALVEIVEAGVLIVLVLMPS